MFFSRITKISISLFLFLLSSPAFIFSQKKDLGLDYLLQNSGYEGVILLYDYNKDEFYTSNVSESKKRTLPASTFKIYNTLMFLSLEVVKDTSYTLPWDGKERMHKGRVIPSWNKDTNLADAFRNSTVWYYKELSKPIELKVYNKYMKKIRYGRVYGRNKKEIDFWNKGKKVGISAKDQISLLVRIHDQKTNFKNEHVDIVKHLMIEEQTDDYILRSKTGWTDAPEVKFKAAKELGWYIGYVEYGRNVYFFAVRLEKPTYLVDENFGEARKIIGKKALAHTFGLEFDN